MRLGEKELGSEEGWLQPLLFHHPELLPIPAMEADFGQVVALARGVPVGGNQIDLLFGSPSGRIALVETKLWQNHEAKREVVAQTLDYAKEIQRWDYETLDRHVRRGAGGTEGVLEKLSRVASAHGAWSRQDLRDAVEMTLRSGRLLILIVGDRIRPEAEELARWCERHLTLRWSLGLVELEVYRNPQNEGLLIVPSLVERIVEARRLVVTVEGARAVDARLATIGKERTRSPSEPKDYTVLNESGLQHCLEQLGRNQKSEVMAQRAAYEEFLRKFFRLGISLKGGPIVASFAPVGSADTEAAMLLEMRGRKFGEGITIAKCACWPKGRKDAIGVSWGIRQLFKTWAGDDSHKRDLVELLRQGIANLIADEANRDKFLEQTSPEGSGDEWTLLSWFSPNARSQLLEELERFCHEAAAVDGEQ
ncbi:MAG: hypothetical protein IRY83_18055 [Chloroflexi bacterium]|nr:hypothetical protein [Chloroflexota bacterium]